MEGEFPRGLPLDADGRLTADVPATGSATRGQVHPAWADYGHSIGSAPRAVDSPEGLLNPWIWSSMHLGAQTMISAMIFGGVFDRFPWLQNVLVYGSDYPHYEGGQDPSAQFAEKLERFGPEVIEKFSPTPNY